MTESSAHMLVTLIRAPLEAAIGTVCTVRDMLQPGSDARDTINDALIGFHAAGINVGVLPRDPLAAVPDDYGMARKKGA